MNTTAEVLYQKLKTLPPSQLVEVDDFLEFIKQRRDQSRQAAGERLAKAMEKLDALEMPPMSAQDIQSEIRARRSEKHSDTSALTEQVYPEPLDKPVCRDPDDDAVLACALTGRVDALISGDDDLLTLKAFRAIPIMTAAEWVRSR